MGRNIRQNVWKTAMILAEEENLFETLIPNNLADAAILAVEPLRKMGLAMQRRVLHRWLRAGDVPDLAFNLIERVRQLLDPASRIAKTNLPKGRHVRRRAGKLFIE